MDGAPEEKGMQVVEDSQSEPLTNDVGLSGDEIDSLVVYYYVYWGK